MYTVSYFDKPSPDLLNIQSCWTGSRYNTWDQDCSCPFKNVEQQCASFQILPDFLPDFKNTFRTRSFKLLSRLWNLKLVRLSSILFIYSSEDAFYHVQPKVSETSSLMKMAFSQSQSSTAHSLQKKEGNALSAKTAFVHSQNHKIWDATPSHLMYELAAFISSSSNQQSPSACEPMAFFVTMLLLCN